MSSQGVVNKKEEMGYKNKNLWFYQCKLVDKLDLKVNYIYLF